MKEQLTPVQKIAEKIMNKTFDGAFLMKDQREGIINGLLEMAHTTYESLKVERTFPVDETAIFDVGFNTCVSEITNNARDFGLSE